MPAVTARALGALCIAAVFATGCGGGSSNSTSGSLTQASSSQTVTPSSAANVTSRDGRFATVTAAGFTDATSSAQGGPFNVLYLALGPRSGGFTTNINVIREP